MEAASGHVSKQPAADLKHRGSGWLPSPTASPRLREWKGNINVIRDPGIQRSTVTAPSMGNPMASRKKVAVVGSGCAGIGAVWALRSTSHEIHLFESDQRLGGHTNTVQFEHDGRTTPVDTGFIVMNSATYPNFIAFLKEIGVPTTPTEMTFGVSRDQGAFEWAVSILSLVYFILY